MFNLTNEQSRKLQEALRKHSEEKTKEMHDDFDKTLTAVVDKLGDEGWTLPVQLHVYAINTIGKTDNIEDLNDFLKQFFSYDSYTVMKKMIDSIMSSKIKPGLKKMLSECWESFNNGHYAICSTGLLSVIEGILSEFSEDKQNVRMMKVCQKQVDSFPEDGSIIDKHIWISYNKYIRNLYKKSNFDDSEPNSINRHWLLHGRSSFEIDDLDCIRLFNAVDSLSIILNKRDSE